MTVPNRVEAISVNSDSAGRCIMILRKNTRRTYFLLKQHEWMRLLDAILAFQVRHVFEKRLHLELTRRAGPAK